MKKKTSNQGEVSERAPRKLNDENPDKGTPNPDDPYEETGPPIKEMPITSGTHHPHQEEILDINPK